MPAARPLGPASLRCGSANLKLRRWVSPALRPASPSSGTRVEIQPRTAPRASLPLQAGRPMDLYSGEAASPRGVALAGGRWSCSRRKGRSHATRLVGCSEWGSPGTRGARANLLRCRSWGATHRGRFLPRCRLAVPARHVEPSTRDAVERPPCEESLDASSVTVSPHSPGTMDLRWRAVPRCGLLHPADTGRSDSWRSVST